MACGLAPSGGTGLEDASGRKAWLLSPAASLVTFVAPTPPQRRLCAGARPEGAAVTPGLLQEVQSLLLNWKGPDLTTYGELVLEGRSPVNHQATAIGVAQSVCLSTDCPPLENAAPHLHASAVEVSPGALVQLSCDPGFYLVGEPVLQCQNQGEWSHPLPSCERK